MSTQLELLGSLRIQRIVAALVDPRLLPQQLIWSGRIPEVRATDEEIIARYETTPVIADLIADDARANVYTMGKPVFEINKIPNIKIGMGLTQSDINLMDRLMSGLGAPDDLGLFNDRQGRFINTVLLGVRQRAEQLRVMMLCDGVGFDQYNRSGIILPTSMSWGMYSDLNVTASVGWDTAASATPVADILTVQLIARTRYGINLNRVTMGTQAFRYMIATTEFQNKAKVNIPVHLTFTNLQTLNLQQMQSIAEATLGMSVELYDARFWSQATDTGALTSSPFLPINNVLLTSTENDGNANAYDFANASVTEASVARVTGGAGIIGGALASGYGPVGYVTPTNVDLNSPGLTYWAVQRGMPRKFQKQASAVITAGSFSDAIATSIPTYA